MAGAAERPAPGSQLSVALEHAARGWPVFPCNAENKAPLVEHGLHAATTDPEQIRAWWTRTPRAMIGVPTGEASGFWALDLDVDGAESGASFIADKGDLPTTLSQSTPRGGRHLLFAWDPERPVANSASKLGRLVDTRGRGGYICVAGSVRSDGAAYAWSTSADTPIAHAPDWLYALYEAARAKPPAQGPRPVGRPHIATGREPYVQAVVDDEVKRVLSTPTGARNNELNRAAFSLGQFVGSGHLSEDDVSQILLAAAEDSGYVATDGARAAMATIRSGLQAGTRSPREVPARTRGHEGGADISPMLDVARRRSGAPRLVEAVSETGEAAAYRFRVTHYDEIGEVHHKAWLIDDLLGAGETTALYGLPGSGKSVLVGDMAAHVASGLPWFDKPVSEGVVLYIAAERAGLVKRRLAGWRKRHGMLGIPLLVIEGGFDFCRSTADAGEIVRIGDDAAKRYGKSVVWVIVDTKAQVLAGADPNSDQDVGALIRSVGVLREAFGCHVTIVDHVPHGAPDRLKGSGALAGAIDGSFLVKHLDDDRWVELGSKRPNDGPDELELHFRLESEVIGERDGKQTTAPVVVPVETPAVQVRIAMAKRPKLGIAGQRVWTAFGRLFDTDQTSPAPSAPGVRPGTRAVALADLKDKAFELGLMADPEPAEDHADRPRWLNARRQAWSRGFKEVQDKGLLREEGGFIWDPTHGDRSVTPSVTESVTERDEL